MRLSTPIIVATGRGDSSTEPSADSPAQWRLWSDGRVEVRDDDDAPWRHVGYFPAARGATR